MKKRMIGLVSAGMLALTAPLSVFAEDVAEESTEETTAAQLAVLEVVLGDYTQFTYSRTVEEITDEDVEAQIETSLESTTPEIVYEESGVVEDGDAIRISAYGTVDGEADDNLTIEDAQTVVGSGELMEEFESQLTGLEVGVETEITVVFPEDYWSEDMAGKTALMQVTILGVGQVQETPELTDEWVQENSDVETVEEYTAQVRSDMEAEAQEYADYDAAAQLTTQLVDTAQVEYDEDILNALVEAEIEQLKEEAQEEEMTYEEYLEEYYGTDEASYAEEILESVKESEKRSAVMAAFADQEGIDLSDEAYYAYVEETALSYGYESGEEYLEELAMWGFESYVRESFEDETVGYVLMTMAQEVPADEIEYDDDDEDIWEYDTEDWEDWEYDTDDWIEEWDDDDEDWEDDDEDWDDDDEDWEDDDDEIDFEIELDDEEE